MSICTSGVSSKNKFWIITAPAKNCVHVLLRILATSTHFLSTGVNKNQITFISILFCVILEAAFAIRIPICCSRTTSVQTRDIWKQTAKFASAITPQTSIQQFIAQNVTLPSTNAATASMSSLREIFSVTSACIIRTANRVKVRLLYLLITPIPLNRIHYGLLPYLQQDRVPSQANVKRVVSCHLPNLYEQYCSASSQV